MKKPVIHEVYRYLMREYPETTGAQFARFEIKRLLLLRTIDRNIESILSKIANATKW